MDNNKQLVFNKIKRIKSLAQNGLSYSESHFDLERFEEMDQLSDELLSLLGNVSIPDISATLTRESYYQTPKVDIRAVIFEHQKILLVKEKSDQKWALPGGWADVGYSPAEVAVKEVEEEAGLAVEADRLLAVYDKRLHKHPESLLYVYKVFILCKMKSGAATAGIDIEDVGFFALDELPELSTGRNTLEQITQVFSFLDHPNQLPFLD